MNNDDERAREADDGHSLVVALLKKEQLTDEQIGAVLAVRSDDEIREQVAAMPYRKYDVRAAVLFKALMLPYALPAKYLRARALEKAHEAQLRLREQTELERKQQQREAADPPAIAALVPAEVRQAALPESMRRRLAAVGGRA